MTSILLSSWVSTWSMLRSMILVLVVTRAPASLQILAAARSRGPPRLRKIPAWAQAARWSPKRSRARRHRQKRLVRGRGKWASKTSKEQLSVEVGRVGCLLAAGDGCEWRAGRVGI